MPTKLLPLTNTSDVETEINEKFKISSDINKKDLQVFVEITENNLYPIKFGFNPDGTIEIDDRQEAMQKPVYIGSKRQFLYKRFNIQQNTIKVDINVEEFKSGWDSSKYIVFRNGYLMNSSMYRIYTATFDNDISRKVMYSRVSLKKNDRLDIFYIESEDNMNPIPINRDVYLAIRKQYATMNYQTLFPIPYPYDSYPRGKNMFFVCDMKGHYLDNRYDYQISKDNEYITVRDKYTAESAYADYLIFTFPYAKQDWEYEENGDEDDMAGNNSGIDLIYSYSILSPNNVNGKISFYPRFDQYDIDKSSVLLFCNTTFIDPERYNIKDNSTIELLNNIDRQHSVYSQFTLVIFKEQNVYLQDNLEFAIDVRQVTATEDQQQTFYIPKLDIEKPSFLCFVGSINFDQKNRFQWKQEIGRMDIADKNDFIDKGRVVTFIFYKPLLPKLLRDKEIYFKKMVFDVPDDTGRVEIPKKLYNKLKFNPSNLILFLNGTFLQPDRYTITNNVISMNKPIDDALDDTKTLVGIYLIAYKTIDQEGDGPYEYTDMKDDNDWIIMDEMYTIPYLPPHKDADINVNNMKYLEGKLTKWFFNGNPVSFNYSGGKFNENGNDKRGLISSNFTYSRGTYNGSKDGYGRINCNIQTSKNTFLGSRDGYGRISSVCNLEPKNPNVDAGFGTENSLILEFYYTRRFLSDAINHSYPFYFECTFKWFYSADDDIRVDMYFGSTEATNGALLDIYWGYPNGNRINSIALNAENRVSTNKPNSDSYIFGNYAYVKNITVGIGITDTEIKAFFYAPINRNGDTVLQERTVYGYLPNPFYITAYMSDPPYWDDKLSVRVTTNFGKTDWVFPELAKRYYN